MIIGSDIQGKRPDLAAVQDQLKIAGRSRSRDPAVVQGKRPGLAAVQDQLNIAGRSRSRAITGSGIRSDYR